MRKVKPRSVNEVIEAWKKQYPRKVRLFDDRNSTDILSSLRALPQNASPKQITTVTGNGGWVGHFCRECLHYFIRGIAFDNHGDEALICYRCISKALKLKD